MMSIQYSKRKGFDFVESWGTALQKATTMVRDDKVKNKILRLFKIWDERSIYDEAFLVDLSGLLSSRKPAQSNQDAQDFQVWPRARYDAVSAERQSGTPALPTLCASPGPICLSCKCGRGVSRLDLSGERYM
ncbi:uncharacterized protein LOC124355802 [Homalodisca vitripennis]|uniref:uncharacterized protein LOC124355802 n=1 Tax=Homalodisca vitripennis TaxID=197043 RepID=UPI001EE9DF27|nr:uncharacterized protein LOC124355802 [Homalodisca vitripennis]